MNNQFGATLYKSIQDEMSTDHWTFVFNPTTIRLELIQKRSPTCHTRHCLTKSELLNWYEEEVYKYDNNIPNVLGNMYFRDYAKHFDMSEKTFADLIRATILELKEEHPENFV